jgi:hypothetical protein
MWVGRCGAAPTSSAGFALNESIWDSQIGVSLIRTVCRKRAGRMSKPLACAAQTSVEGRGGHASSLSFAGPGPSRRNPRREHHVGVCDAGAPARCVRQVRGDGMV